MSANCLVLVRRPVVWTFNWYCCWLLIGRAPTRPIAATVLCAPTALMMSDGARSRLFSRLMSNQIRIEYFCRDSSAAWPTPVMRLISSMTLIVMKFAMKSTSCVFFGE